MIDCVHPIRRWIANHYAPMCVTVGWPRAMVSVILAAILMVRANMTAESVSNMWGVFGETHVRKNSVSGQSN